ncbi:TatD family hydrolase [Mycoplasmopsis cynos]|nr:TatD family hydrolase [Mycoplasmopsis cynos]WAM07062.1 TatD family hydrolase [Mycoplasmopsis cynos]
MKIPSRENQIGSFENQIRLAIKYNLPVVIHIRDKENEFQNLSRCLWYFKKIPEYKSDASYFCISNIEWAKKFMEFPNLLFSFSG